MHAAYRNLFKRTTFHFADASVTPARSVGNCCDRRMIKCSVNKPVCRDNEPVLPRRGHREHEAGTGAGNPRRGAGCRRALAGIRGPGPAPRRPDEVNPPGLPDGVRCSLRRPRHGPSGDGFGMLLQAAPGQGPGLALTPLTTWHGTAPHRPTRRLSVINRERARRGDASAVEGQCGGHSSVEGGGPATGVSQSSSAVMPPSCQVQMIFW